MEPKFLAEWSKAQTSLINGLYDQAIVHYSALISQDPKNYEILLQRAVAFTFLTNLESAVKDCDQAILLEPKRPEAFWRRGVANLNSGHLQAAQTDLQTALTLAMENGESGITKQITISLKRLDAELKNNQFRDALVVEQTRAEEKPQQKLAAAVPLVGKIPYRWYQTNNKVGVEIKFKLDNKDDLKSTIESKHVEIGFPIEAGRDFGLSLDLHDEIIPESSTVVVSLTNIEILLDKKNKNVNWPNLEAPETLNEKVAEDLSTKSAPGAIDPKSVSQPFYPSSSKVKKDWNKLEKEIDSEMKKEGEEDPLNSLFKQIYQNSNEETRRAMIKSFQTSDGTVLSTNWDEVKDKDYQKKDRPEPPKGQEWRKWEK